MKKLSAVLVLTVGVFVFGNAQSTEKAVESKEVKTIQKAEPTEKAAMKVEKSTLTLEDKSKVSTSKELNSNNNVLLQKRTLNNPESVSKIKVESLKKEEVENSTNNKEENTNK